MLFQLAIFTCVDLVEYLQQIREIFQFIFSYVVVAIDISLRKCGVYPNTATAINKMIKFKVLGRLLFLEW